MLQHAVEQFVAKTRTAADEVYRSLEAVQPMGRVGKAEEIAHSVPFCCPMRATTGSLFAVDGEYTCQGEIVKQFFL